MSTSPFALKSALRKTMIRTLRAVSEAELERQSRAVSHILFASPFFAKAHNVACYLHMAKGELRTDLIVEEALNQGKSLYTPCLTPAAPVTPISHSPTSPATTSLSSTHTSPAMRMLRLYSKADLEQCPLDKWGILDPGQSRRDIISKDKRQDVMDTDIDPLDLVLLPGVAFDENCNRLGRGKAYYDRFLQTYSESRSRPLLCQLVALALEPQMLPPGEIVPTTETDFQLDGVVAPSGIIWRDGVDGIDDLID